MAGPMGEASKQSGAKPTEVLRDFRSIESFRIPIWRWVIFITLGVCSAGILFLFCHWFIDLYIFLLFSPCTIQDAQYVFITLTDKRRDYSKIQTIKDPHGQAVKFFEFHSVRFVYDNGEQTYLAVPETAPKFAETLSKSVRTLASGSMPDGVTDADRDEAHVYYGRNQMHVPRPHFLVIFLSEALTPLCIFQYFSVAIWTWEAYYEYAFIILGITMLSIITNAWSVYIERKRLADAAEFDCDMQVVVNGQLVTKRATDLCPGDIIEVGTGKVPCDLVLLQGEVVADETVLTGESVPVRKVAFDPDSSHGTYSTETHTTNTLFSGTTVLVVRAPPTGPVLAIVVSIAYSTAKGKLLRTILYPKMHNLHFIRDAFYFIIFMFIVGLSFYIWDAVNLVKFNASTVTLIQKAADMVTTAVPPALPACLAISTTVVVQRLRRKKVYVLENRRVALAGQLDVICFDKTGTLTEIGLDLSGALPTYKGIFGTLISESWRLPEEIRLLFGCCHGLTYLDGKVVGDPLETQLWQASGLSFEVEEGAAGSGTMVVSSAEGSAKWKVLRRFDFSSEKMRSACLVQSADGSLCCCVKGSPEKLEGFMDRASLPETFHSQLEEYAGQGLRVIALALKKLPGLTPEAAMVASQEELEAGADFLGLAIMVNNLKPGTIPAIHALNGANIRTIMITGDHVRTAVTMARQCGILPEREPVVIIDVASGPLAVVGLTFTLVSGAASGSQTLPRELAVRGVADGTYQCAVSGRAFQKLHDDLEMASLLALALQRANVFARTSPEHKRIIVDLLGPGEFDANGYEVGGLQHSVGFIGDGANDMGALKAALVGVSLCEGEASIAAPLTSSTDSVECFVTVVAEGRCTLTTSIILFKFIMVYAYIQVFSLAYLYSMGLTVGNYQYLIQDLFYTTTLASAMALTHPAKKLSQDLPIKRVISPPVVAAVLVQFIIMSLFQISAIQLLKGPNSGWPTGAAAAAANQTFVPFNPYANPDDVINMDTTTHYPENGTLMIMATAQIMIVAAIFNRGPPFRRSVFTNWVLMLVMAGQLGFLLYMYWAPVSSFKLNVPGICYMPLDYQWRLFLLGLGNFAAAFLADILIALLYNYYLEKIRQQAQLKELDKQAATMATGTSLLGSGSHPYSVELATLASQPSLAARVKSGVYTAVDNVKSFTAGLLGRTSRRPAAATVYDDIEEESRTFHPGPQAT